MKSLYIKAEHVFKEQIEMEEPLMLHRERYGDHKADYQRDLFNYSCNLEIYKEHIDSLRKVPCRPGDIWQEGVVYEEGKNYELKEARTYTHHPAYGYGCAECCNGDRCDEDCDATYRRPNCPYCKGSGWYKEKPYYVAAINTPPPQSEGELWKDVREIICKYSGNPSVSWEAVKNGLTDKYALSLRSDKPEAVEQENERLRAVLEGIKTECYELGFPYEAYKDNTAARQMAIKLNEISEAVSKALKTK